jgi:hypothetical protein
MKMTKFWLGFFFVALTAVVACTKEYSFEDPLGGQASGPVLGNNCIINKIVEFDTITNTGLAALNFNFNSNGRVLTLAEVDSIALNNILSTTYTYNIDTVRLDPDQFFVLDATGRVKQFTGYADPYDPLSDILDFEYLYDASGKLTTRKVSDATLPGIVLLQSDYTYTGSNLTRITTKIPLLNATYFDATYEYQFDRVPKNYMNVLSDAEELAPYLPALNMGSRSLNPIKKIKVLEFDPLVPGGAAIDSTVTTFSNYTYSRDGYVLSVDLGGDEVPGIALSAGRNKFGYFCR